MFPSLVTYHVHKCDPLPVNSALAYQYILAGNGLFIRAETHFFEAILPIASRPVRGLAPLYHHFRLKVSNYTRKWFSRNLCENTLFYMRTQASPDKTRAKFSEQVHQKCAMGDMITQIAGEPPRFSRNLCERSHGILRMLELNEAEARLFGI